MAQKKYNKRPKTNTSKNNINLRKVLRKIFGLASLFGIILGAHGLYIHFTRMTTYSIEEIIKGFPSQNKLFTVIPVGPLGDTIRWMSDLGFESWFLPVLIGIAGFLVFRNRGKLVDLLYSIFR